MSSVCAGIPDRLVDSSQTDQVGVSQWSAEAGHCAGDVLHFATSGVGAEGTAESAVIHTYLLV